MSNDIAPEAFERMKALVRRMLAKDDENRNNKMVAAYQSGPLFLEARAIMTLLAPVDEDRVRARKIAEDVAEGGASFDWSDLEQAAHAGLLWGKTLGGGIGRQLERGGE